jgi:DNA helicase-2/ATP-dependent DNA helicase PcrA
MRYSEVPKIEKVLHGKDLYENIRQSITMFRQKGYKIVSIVCKDLQQSRNLYDYLQKSGVESIQLIDNPNEELKEQIIVIPSYLSKGLEFDAVIIPNTSRERYGSENIIDMKLLYVSVTRAHHELHIFYHGELTPLLGNENYNENNEDTLSNIL